MAGERSGPSSSARKRQGNAGAVPPEHAPAYRVSDQVRLRRRELMAAELERVAFDLFIEQGYAEVSVEDIARTAGVSARTFYRYFATKEDVLALYPRRLTDFVRSALNDEPVGRPIFDTFSSVLVKLAQSMDLEELRRWCSVVMSDPHTYSSMALHDVDLRTDMEPLFLQRVARQLTDPLHFDLALRAGQVAMTAATSAWFTGGGDFVELVKAALHVFARGFDDTGAPAP
jgi:AcrR family transcriptional regulator